MSLASGAKLGPYEILSPLGAGGMGEVYRARDSKLNREVALKVLPTAMANDAERMARFQREAQVLASLNHPNIASIYGLEESGGVRALVMELVEGPTLAERIAPRSVGAVRDLSRSDREPPLPLHEALEIAFQIAEALEYAHERGIIHRDLKPANIKVTPEGTVKVLDFGLAKALDAEASQSELQDSPTIALNSAMTREGAVLGTAAYMPPEQAKGRPVDRRADIWSFGCVLFEMLTGQRVFKRDSISETVAAVLGAEVDWAALPAETPRDISRLLRRCLQKDPKQRLQAIGDARLTIEETLSGGLDAALSGESGGVRPDDGNRAAPVTGTSPLLRALPWVLVPIFIFTTIVAWFRTSSTQVQTVRSSILAPEGTSFVFSPTAGGPVLSPDGTQILFVEKDSSGNELLWVRQLDSLAAQPLKGTEGASVPFWSPDNRSIGFFVPGKLEKIDIAGGGPQVICDAPSGRGGTWSQEGVIVFAPSVYGGLDRVPAAGGTPTPLGHPEELHGAASLRWPVFLPDGRHFLYFSSLAGSTSTSGAAPGKLGIYVGSLDGEASEYLFPSESQALYASPGYLLFIRGGNLMAQPFDADALKLSGHAFAVAGQVANPLSWKFGHFSVSQNGVLAYDAGGNQQNEVVWLDEKGQRTGTVSGPERPWYIRLSPDGKVLAESCNGQQTGNTDIWLVDLARGVTTRLTFNPAADNVTVWSPDGSSIVFTSYRTGQGDLYIKSSNGAGSEKLLLESDAQKFPTDWSHDGRFIAYEQLDTKNSTGWDIWILPFGGDRKPYPFLQTQFNEKNAVFSPDGRWLAYQSDESGRSEIYVTAFPGPGGKWQVSMRGGSQPKWRKDGKALYFIGPASKLLKASAVEKDSAIEVGQPSELFQARLPEDYASWMDYYDVAHDGKRFLILAPQQGATTPVTLITNWAAQIKKTVTSDK